MSEQTAVAFCFLVLLEGRVLAPYDLPLPLSERFSPWLHWTINILIFLCKLFLTKYLSQITLHFVQTTNPFLALSHNVSVPSYWMEEVPGCINQIAASGAFLLNKVLVIWDCEVNLLCFFFFFFGFLIISNA